MDVNKHSNIKPKAKPTKYFILDRSVCVCGMRD